MGSPGPRKAQKALQDLQPTEVGEVPQCPLSPLFLGRGSPPQIDYRKKGALFLTSLLEDLVKDLPCHFLAVDEQFDLFWPHPGSDYLGDEHPRYSIWISPT